MTRALMVLADGTVFEGRSLGARGETFGEAVFNTGLTGYQEVLTDPSYHGQIVTMTYPHQGNYGVNDMDAEADRPWVRGFVAREVTPRASSWRATEDLQGYLHRHGVVGIEGVDTRKLTRRLRTAGAMPVAISTDDLDPGSLLERVRAAPRLEDTDLVDDVTPATAYDADPDALAATGDLGPACDPDPRIDGARIAAIDLGMKRSILRCLTSMGAAVRVFGAGASRSSIDAFAPDGIFISNGPGDPSRLGATAGLIAELVASGVPTFGICLGHQVLGTALGGSTYKLSFGHRGGNHPVKSLETGRVEITTQNHGFAVDTGVGPSGDEAWRVLSGSGPRDWIWPTPVGEVALTHFDLNDGTLEGLRCLDIPAFSVQYHPEAAPGPHDSRYLFGRFADLVAGTENKEDADARR